MADPIFLLIVTVVYCHLKVSEGERMRMWREMKIIYEIPVFNPAKKKEAFLDPLAEKFPKKARYFLTVFEKSDMFVKLLYEVKTRNETGTSQESQECGFEGERYKGSFSYSFCGLEDYNADLNATINIAGNDVKSPGTPEGLGVGP